MYKRPDSDAMIDRMVELTSRLGNGAHLSVSELAEEFNVSTRTIQRDLEKLKAHLQIDRIDGKWRLVKAPMLSAEDIGVLDMLESMAAEQGESFASRATKLLRSIAEPDVQVYATKLATEDLGTHFYEAGRLEQAIRQKVLVEFDYTKGEGVRT